MDDVIRKNWNVRLIRHKRFNSEASERHSPKITRAPVKFIRAKSKCRELSEKLDRISNMCQDQIDVMDRSQFYNLTEFNKTKKVSNAQKHNITGKLQNGEIGIFDNTINNSFRMSSEVQPEGKFYH